MTQEFSCSDNRATLHASRQVATAAEAVPAPPRKARVLRYSLLTVFGAPTNFLLYALLLYATGLSAATATVVAAMFVIVPKFLLSKYWVWKQAGTEHVRREITVYLGVTAVSLLFATTVGWALDERGVGNFLLLMANLGAFTVMWVLRFLVLDRYAFVSTHQRAGIATI